MNHTTESCQVQNDWLEQSTSNELIPVHDLINQLKKPTQGLKNASQGNITLIKQICFGYTNASLKILVLCLQLGKYLTKNQPTNTTLVLFSLQICKALVYLQGMNMVHRCDMQFNIFHFLSSVWHTLPFIVKLTIFSL